MTPSAVDADVVVVGGGPVGSLLALELTRLGVDVVVVEAEPRTVDVPKAGTIHARSLQLLARRGHLTAPDPGAAGTATTFHYAGQVGLTIRAPAGEGPPIAGIGQSDLERLWRDRFTRLGGRTIRPAPVLAVRDRGDLVELETDDVTLRARWVVGADGARSVVRRHGGFAVRETSPTAAALLGLATLERPSTAPPGWVRTEAGWTVINVNPRGPSRVITFDLTGPHPDHRSPLTPEELQRTVDTMAGRPVPMRDIHALSRFSDFSRLVDSFRHGRLLVVGDAAHVHFPLGGQGLNLGIADALHLGWRLADVVAGRSDATVLDDFSRERHAAARIVLDNVADQREHMRSGPSGDDLRARLLRRFADPQANAALGTVVSGQAAPRSVPLDRPEPGQLLANATLTTSSGTTSLVELLASATGSILLHRGSCPSAPSLPANGRSLAVTEDLPPILLRPDGVVAWTAAEPHEPDPTGGLSSVTAAGPLGSISSAG